MAMSEDQIREAMRRSFSNYATKVRRASLVLSNSLAVLTREADLAKLPQATFDKIAREEMEVAERRMKLEPASVQPILSEAS